MTLGLRLLTGLLLLVMATTAVAAPPDPSTAPRRTLIPLSSDREFEELFLRWSGRVSERRGTAEVVPIAAQPIAAVPSAPAPSTSPSAVTNSQHAGVDEGGIVKLHGEHLVILRRGRLFTVRIGEGGLRAVASVDAFGPSGAMRDAWYDELVIAADTVAVIGYSKRAGGAEIGLFDISRTGQLTHKATYHLRADDYYSERGYSSRLIGTKLIVHTPFALRPTAQTPFFQLVGMRRWYPGVRAEEFRRTVPPDRIYRTEDDFEAGADLTLHNVSVCDLAKPEFECKSLAVIGPPGDIMYVSPRSVFVWTADRTVPPGTLGSILFRIPIDGSPPSALKVEGRPIDAFSFLEGVDGMLNVLVESVGGFGGHPSATGAAAGDLRLLRVPLASFSGGRDRAPSHTYRPLPNPLGIDLRNRYIGPYLVYGASVVPSQPRLFVTRYADAGTPVEVPLGHSVERIEALGTNAVAIGADGRDLALTSVRLGPNPVAIERHTRKNVGPKEARSHGFFYKPEGEEQGVIGLSIIGNGKSSFWRSPQDTAALLYVRSSGLRLSALGTLSARPVKGDRDDGCVVSCVDWYGDTRPLFVGRRVFALMGYELVEGALTKARITEVRRISFAPHASAQAR